LVFSLDGGLEPVGAVGDVGDEERPGLAEELDVEVDLEPELSNSSFKPDLGNNNRRVG